VSISTKCIKGKNGVGINSCWLFSQYFFI